MTFKTPIKYCICTLFKLFPIKQNRIMFIAYAGKEFSCNPRAMYEYLKSLNGDFDFVWCIYDSSKIKDDVKKVSPKGFGRIKNIYFHLTSKYIFSNMGFDYSLKRKNTIWINTWHGGGAFKRINWKMNMTKQMKKSKEQNIKITDIYVSSSKKFTEIQSKDEFLPEDKFVPIGMPRNDALFNPEKVKMMSERARKFFNLKEDDFVVLYAPTYRGLEDTKEYDLNFDFVSANRRLRELSGKDVKFLFRAHRSMLHQNAVNKDFIIDATNYPDMQDLLCAVDFLITDYSSSMWDYSLLKKPAALFTPDLKKYQSERGFYTPVETWPYRFYETNEDFVKNLTLKTDAGKIESYQKLLGSYETGSACENLWKLCKEKNQ